MTFSRTLKVRGGIISRANSYLGSFCSSQSIFPSQTMQVLLFEEILDQAITMLQRRRRVAYRTLQVQFHLDDHALEALKDELLYAQQIARDEDGRVLVWTGGAETPPAPALLSTPPVSQPPTQEAALAQTAP